MYYEGAHDVKRLLHCYLLNVFLRKKITHQIKHVSSDFLKIH